eukprot:5447582-Prymnesium_polylepis.1
MRRKTTTIELGVDTTTALEATLRVRCRACRRVDARVPVLREAPCHGAPAPHPISAIPFHVAAPCSRPPSAVCTPLTLGLGITATGMSGWVPVSAGPVVTCRCLVILLLDLIT